MQTDKFEELSSIDSFKQFNLLTGTEKRELHFPREHIAGLLLQHFEPLLVCRLLVFFKRGQNVVDKVDDMGCARTGCDIRRDYLCRYRLSISCHLGSEEFEFDRRIRICGALSIRLGRSYIWPA